MELRMVTALTRICEVAIALLLALLTVAVLNSEITLISKAIGDLNFHIFSAARGRDPGTAINASQSAD
jgi:hypothetical protein